MSKLFRTKVELHLGPVLGWVDITADVRGPVTITRGRTSAGGRAEYGRCSLRLNNPDRYAPRNPTGPWYGLIGRNTPLRVSAGPLAGPLVARFAGEVSEWPPRWNLPGTDRYVDVEASGILRRLGQGEQPKLSPLRRTVAASALAYWPLEDGAGASVGGSALSGQSPMRVAGTVAWTDITNVVTGATVRRGTDRIADVSAGASLVGDVPASVTASTAAGWSAMAAVELTDIAAITGDVVLLDITTPGGTYVRWQLTAKIVGGLDMRLVAYNADGAATLVTTGFGVVTSFYLANVSVWQNGSNISAGVRWAGASYIEGTGSVAGTLAGVTSIGVNTRRATSTKPLGFGHVAVWAGRPFPIGGSLVDYPSLPPGFRLGPLDGYWYETAADRLVRVAGEEGVPVTVIGSPAAGRLGYQATASLSELADQSVDVDGGYLYEQRDVLGLVYRTCASLYNQTPTPIAYTGQLAPPFEPIDDADAVRNDVVVKRPDGSSVRAVQTTGPLAAVPPPAGVGVYRTEVELNCAGDDQLADQASWRRHLGTVDRPRYEALSVELSSPEWQAAPAAMAALLAVDAGDVLEVTGPPAWAAGDIRTLALGYTETIAEYTWKITFSGVPAQPYDIAVVDGPARVGIVGATLAAPWNGAATMQLATTAASGRWTTNPAAFPLDLRVGEERVRVSLITGAASPQTATVAARGLNGVTAAWQAGTPVDVWLPAVPGL